VVKMSFTNTEVISRLVTLCRWDTGNGCQDCYRMLTIRVPEDLTMSALCFQEDSDHR